MIELQLGSRFDPKSTYYPDLKLLPPAFLRQRFYGDDIHARNGRTPAAHLHHSRVRFEISKPIRTWTISQNNVHTAITGTRYQPQRRGITPITLPTEMMDKYKAG